MKRRAFLGFLGGAAVSGPTVAKAAGEMGLADLSLPNAIGEAVLPSAYGYATQPDNKGWAKDALKRLVGRSAQQIAREKRDTYVQALDSDTACLRSVAIGAKIRRQKRLNYETNIARDEERYRGIIAGWWD